MDDTENTESQTNETNDSQTNDTSSNSELSFSSDALSNGNQGPNFDIDWDNWENNTKTGDNDTSDNDSSDENRRAAEAWVEMHQHTDWGSGITVDEVFNNDNKDSGYSTDNNSTTATETNNQSRTENQGDYATSSKENSNVQTTTIGKQDEITTTPDTITENKGLISNSNIQSVEGLDFQQKDKDDLNSKKDRDKAEEEDKADQLKNELRNDAEKTAANNKEGKGFQVGNKANKQKEDLANKEKNNFLWKIEKEIEKANKEKEDLKKQKEDLNKQTEAKAAVAYRDRQNANKNLESIAKEAGKKSNTKELPTRLDDANEYMTDEEIEEIISSNSKTLGKYAKEYTDALRNANEKNQIFQDVKRSYMDDVAYAKYIDSKIEANNKRLEDLSKGLEALSKKLEDAKKNEDAANKELEDYRGKHNTDVIPEAPEKPEVPEEKPAVPEEKPEVPEEGQKLVDPTNPMQKAKDLEDKANNLRNGKYDNEEERQEANDLADSYDALSASMKNAAEASKNIVDENGKVDLNKCTPKQIDDWEKSNKQLSKNLNDVLSKSKSYEQHYGNKQFTRDIAKANDFKVPGTDKTYSQLSIEMATKSPQIAKAMYDAKADRYKEKAEQTKNPVSKAFYNALSKIENLKSNMSQNFIGSKLTFADNKVRNQFNAMADLNMKATYAAYNNRLNHPEDYQPEDLEEARQQIDQAHALQYASAALKASTGALSGLGDSIKDGVYGTTNAKDLSGYQQTLADIGAFSQIVLGMGVTPLANKGYNTFNNLYPGSLFSKDIDKDGFAWAEEYGNNPAAESILSIAQLSYGVSLVMNPLTLTNGITMIKNSVQNGLNAAYGVRNDARKLVNLTNDITSYFEDVKEKEGIPPEVIPEIDNAIKEITTTTEEFKVNSDEINNFDNWLEGSGSNTADNGKFNQKLSYEDWLKLIKADPAMQEYAKKLAAEKNKNAQEGNVNSRINS